MVCITPTLQAGALDILQSPISEQADRLHFLAAKWQHTLQTVQPAANTDFSADCGDSVQQSFTLSLAQMPPLVSCRTAFVPDVSQPCLLQGLTFERSTLCSF
jgi:hypothetical protein